jgi:hypothetical protein
VTGFTSEFIPFVRKIREITEITPNRVVLKVVIIEIEKIFDELDLDGSFEVSRSGPMPADCSFEDSQSGPASRRLKKLTFAKWFKKNIIQPINKNIIKPIGDLFTDAYNGIADLLDGRFTGKLSLVSIDEEWDVKLGDNANITGHAKADVSLNVELRIGSSSGTYASIGASAGYSLKSVLAASAGLKGEYQKQENILSKRYSKIVWAGSFPIEIYVKPSIDADVKASISLTVDAEVGFSAKGGTSIGLAYENNAIKPIIVPPHNKVEEIFPTLEGTATFSAVAGIVLNVEAGLYYGLASVAIGLRTGLDVTVAGGVTSIGNVVLPTVKNFDMSLAVSIPVSAQFLYGKYPFKPNKPLWEKNFPIITLPSLKLEVLDDHQCVLGNTGPVASFSLKAETSYPKEAWINNPVESGDWYIFSDGWSANETTATEASFKKTSLQSFSPQPKGNVTIAAQPKIPPFLKLVETVSLDTLFLATNAVPCTNSTPPSTTPPTPAPTPVPTW